MKRRNRGSKPSGSPNTVYYLPFSELEALSYKLMHPSLQKTNRCLYEYDNFPSNNPQILHTPMRPYHSSA